MSEFDPDNRVTSGGAGYQEIRQGGNVSSKLPGRRTASGPVGSPGEGSTTVSDLPGRGGGRRADLVEGIKKSIVDSFTDPRRFQQRTPEQRAADKRYEELSSRVAALEDPKDQGQ